MLPMEFTLKHNKKFILRRYLKEHWWVNGFQVGHARSIYNLHMRASITFRTSGMAQVFQENLKPKRKTSRYGKKVTIYW